VRPRRSSVQAVAGESEGVAGEIAGEQATRKYYLILLLGLFFEYARPGSFVPGLDALKLYSLIPGGLFIAIWFYKGPGLNAFSAVFKDPMAKWLMIYLGLIALSVLHADVTTKAFEMFTVALGYIIYFFLIARIVTTRRRLMGVFVVLAVAHIFLIVMNPSFVLDPSNRYYIVGATFLGDTNDYTLSLCILMPMVLEAAIAAESKLKKILLWAAFLVFGLSIVSSQSRGAALGIAAVLVYLWLISPRKMLTLAGFALLSMILLLYASDAFFERMATIKDYQDEGSAMGRITAWTAGTKMMLDHPLLGVGAGHFAISFGTKYLPADIVGPYPWLTAHSIYFLIIGELGIPGIVTLLTLIIGNFLTSSKVRKAVISLPQESITPELQSGARTLYVLNASMVGFAVAGAFLSAAYYPHIYLLTGVMIAQRCMLIKATNLNLYAIKGRASRPFRRPQAGART